MKRGALLLVTALCLTALLGLTAAALDTEQTTVLGLYAQWQAEGMPEEVEEVFFDRDTNRLVVVLEAGSQETAQYLQSSVSDGENLEIRFQEPPREDTPEEAAAKRREGALVLFLAYAGMMAAAGVLFLCGRKRRPSDSQSEPPKNPFTRL